MALAVSATIGRSRPCPAGSWPSNPGRVRRTSRHNHTVLSRTLELHQETLRQLRPDAFTKTYAATGRVSLASNSAGALRAAG